MRGKWLQAIGRHQNSVLNNGFICEKHFEKSCLAIRNNKTILRPHAIPTIFNEMREVPVSNDIKNAKNDSDRIIESLMSENISLKNELFRLKLKCDTDKQFWEAKIKMLTSANSHLNTRIEDMKKESVLMKKQINSDKASLEGLRKRLEILVRSTLYYFNLTIFSHLIISFSSSGR